jgi:hypothetical protein
MVRKFFILVCLFIFSINVYALASDKKDKILSLESTNLEYNLDNINADETIEKTIKIKNKLNEDLIIKEGRTTCECIKITVKRQVVKRNEIFEAEIMFDSSGMSKGTNIEEVVYILTDNRKYELIRLAILATIVDSQ